MKLNMSTIIQKLDKVKIKMSKLINFYLVNNHSNWLMIYKICAYILKMYV